MNLRITKPLPEGAEGAEGAEYTRVPNNKYFYLPGQDPVELTADCPGCGRADSTTIGHEQHIEYAKVGASSRNTAYFECGGPKGCWNDWEEEFAIRLFARVEVASPAQPTKETR